MITLNTKLVGLLGYPLTFTFSPKMHNSTFKEMGLDYYYIPFEIVKEDLPDVLTGIRHMNFAGFNVTKPNKVRVVRYLDEVDELAAQIGAVNTVKITKDKKLIGYNTDGEGYVASLEDQLGITPEGKKFVLAGAGGAGRAIAFTLAKYGAERIEIYDTNLDCREKVAAEINANVCNCAVSRVLSDENIKKSIDEGDVLINATGIGMMPHTDRTPFNKDLLNPNIIVSDVTYNPLKTRLLKEAEEKGCQIHNGIGMMIHQGRKAFEIWTGIQPPYEFMEKVVKNIINNL